VEVLENGSPLYFLAGQKVPSGFQTKGVRVFVVPPYWAPNMAAINFSVSL
jgi:hypothetical protein